MRKYINCIPYTFLSLLFVYSTITFGMLKRRWKQSLTIEQMLYQKNIRARISTQNIQEVNEEIHTILSGIDRECVEELHALTAIPHDFLEDHIDLGRKIMHISLKEDDRNAFHDPNMPQPMYNTAVKALEENDINPRNVKLQYKKSADFINFSTNASARGRIRFSGNYPIETIRIYEYISEQQQEEQDFILRHEAQHILLGHTALSSLAFPNESTTLISIQERQADLYAASKNSLFACTGSQYRCTSSNSQILDPNAHCKEMLLMCALMKRKEELS